MPRPALSTISQAGLTPADATERGVGRSFLYYLKNEEGERHNEWIDMGGREQGMEGKRDRTERRGEGDKKWLGTEVRSSKRGAERREGISNELGGLFSFHFFGILTSEDTFLCIKLTAK